MVEQPIISASTSKFSIRLYDIWPNICSRTFAADIIIFGIRFAAVLFFYLSKPSCKDHSTIWRIDITVIPHFHQVFTRILACAVDSICNYFGTCKAFAACTALCKCKFAISPPHPLDTMIALVSFEKILALFASLAPLLLFILLHFLCPTNLIGTVEVLFWNKSLQKRGFYFISPYTLGRFLKSSTIWDVRVVISLCRRWRCGSQSWYRVIVNRGCNLPVPGSS